LRFRVSENISIDTVSRGLYSLRGRGMKSNGHIKVSYSTMWRRVRKIESGNGEMKRSRCG